jgi:hypothetical protein
MAALFNVRPLTECSYLPLVVLGRLEGELVDIAGRAAFRDRARFGTSTPFVCLAHHTPIMTPFDSVRSCDTPSHCKSSLSKAHDYDLDGLRRFTS